MYAVIEAAGRQYRVEPGETVKMEKIAGEPGTTVVYDKVLVVTTDAGAQIGKPYVAGATVSGTIVPGQLAMPLVRVSSEPPA